MNPFTRFLRQWTRDDAGLDQLVEHCDALESLVIRVYKEGEATAEDEARYQKIRRWMRDNYASWQEALRPFWQQAQVAGRPAAEDPFLRLTDPESASAFVGEWEAMQFLPAAREALNRFVIQQSNEDGKDGT